MNKRFNKIVVTGGAGFIGSALVKFLLNKTDNIVFVIDNLSYAGNLESLKEVENNKKYFFEQCDINNTKKIEGIFSDFQPNYLMHLAAESHVDRSIADSSDFIKTNILGTYSLLEVTRKYLEKTRNKFRFHHISTDEVFGELGSTGYFSESTAYNPSSPYSASKAASDHLVRAWNRTYNIPVVLSNCSNNYGPYQFPEKFIPRLILNALKGKDLPIYGNGKQVRDWLFVEDHVLALYRILKNGVDGETYAIGGSSEKKNIDVAYEICNLLEELMPNHQNSLSSGGLGFQKLISFIEDRPGHDHRYAIDSSKIQTELGWQANETFSSGLKKTVKWYLENTEWLNNVSKSQSQQK